MKNHAVTTGETAFIELPAALAGDIERVARRTRKSVAGLIEQAIADLLDAKAAEAAYRKGGKRFTLDQVKHELGLAR